MVHIVTARAGAMSGALIALGVPVVGGLLPATGLLACRVMWLGLPAAVIWLFGWLPLTALCLYLAGRLQSHGGAAP